MSRRIEPGTLSQRKAASLDSSLIELIVRCQKRLDEHEVGHKEGDVWRNDRAKYHLEKAHGELGMAGYHCRNGNDNQIVTEIADAVNHLLFAIALVREENRP